MNIFSQQKAEAMIRNMSRNLAVFFWREGNQLILAHTPIYQHLA